MATNDLAQIKTGDRVWLGAMGYPPKMIKTIAKVTPTQFVIAWNGDGYTVRFRRNDGYEIGGKYLSQRIVRLASPEECAAWDAEQAESNRRSIEERERRERIEAEQQRLCDMFASQSVVVGAESWGEQSQRKDRWYVALHFLTADQVEALAALVRSGSMLSAREVTAK